MGTHLNCSNVMSAFSALHLLRNYNQFLGPPDPLYQPLLPPECLSTSAEASFCLPAVTCNTTPFIGFSPLENPVSVCSRSNMHHRRQRGEKKAIPEEQKDERYFERRKRNNQAAKKSRDARRFREDQIALRAMQLEHENAILTAQNITLREEIETLRQLLLHRKKSQIVS